MHGFLHQFLKLRVLFCVLLGVYAICVVWHFTWICRYSSSRERGCLWGWDNNFYYSWGRSLALDGDIDFRNDFESLAAMRGTGATGKAFARYLRQTPPTPTGRLPNKYGIGMGLLALPALWLAQALAALQGAWTGRPVSPFAAVYILAFAASMVAAGLAGLAVAFSILAPRFGRRDALLAILAGTFGTSLVYYIWFEPTMAHAAGFCFNTLQVAAALAWDKRLGRALAGASGAGLAGAALVLGLALGFSMSIRYTNLVFALVPAALALARRRGLSARARRSWWRLCALSLALAAAGALGGFLPQMIAWKKIYGTWLTYSYQGETLHPWPRHGLHVLFGLSRGLFVWTPLALLACAGLVRAAARGSGLALAGLAVLLATTWIYGGWNFYTLGGSYGMRGFVDASFFFMLGLAEVLKWCRQAARRGHPRLRGGLVTLLAALVLWNGYLVTAYRAGIEPWRGVLVPREIAAHWPAWEKQFAKDYDFAARLRARHFPLFTPLSGHRTLDKQSMGIK